jgi:hypothetical protein
MGLHCSFWTSKTQVMAKRRVESQTANLIPDQKKSRINPIYLAIKSVLYTVGKISQRKLQLCFKLHFNLKFARKIMGLQSHRSPIWHNFRTLTPESRERKNHLDVGSVTSHRVYYKGEGGGFPQVWVMMNLMCVRVICASS